MILALQHLKHPTMAHIFVTTEAELKPAFDPEKPSKTQLKNVSDALQTLGVRLVEVSKEKLLQLDLPERLFDAIMDAKKITANGATARQKQFIGKQMRNLGDEQVAFIKEKLLAWDGLSKSETNKLHLVEYWRDALLANDEAMQEYVKAVPTLSPDHMQAMRVAMRQARKDAAAAKPPKNARVLFQLIKETLLSPAPATVAQSAEQED
jgi:ribosome-associated protein